MSVNGGVRRTRRTTSLSCTCAKRVSTNRTVTIHCKSDMDIEQVLRHVCPVSWEEFHIILTSKWARCHLKSRALRLFTQPFIQGADQRKIKAPRHWPFCGEFTGDSVNSLHKGPVTRKMFPFDDVIMTGQDGRYFADDSFKFNFLNGNVRIVLKISL